MRFRSGVSIVAAMLIADVAAAEETVHAVESCAVESKWGRRRGG
jgi:hypothetical protein